MRGDRGMLNNVKVQNKLFIIVAIGIIAASLIAVLSFLQARTMTNNIEMIYEEKFLPNDWLSNAIAVNLRINTTIVEMMSAETIAEAEELYSDINNGIERVYADFDKYESLPLTDEEKTRLADFYATVNLLETD